ncbi:MAG: TIGR04053 family radical SAM/SPASM domain-containing protein [Candidatus Korarchaeota archaeon]|nr:TIGR04053 family radical SAM/SPASM domain-containing protein [Candidatus Korarchaeota archaeon]
MPHPRLNLEDRPILIFWEMTKACLLKCRHCRAEAIPDPLPGELSAEEGKRLIDQIRGFGEPYPVLILTGGDPLMREDLEEIVRYATGSGLRVGIAPAVTEKLLSSLDMLSKYGVRFISISLDGMRETHDYIRGVRGHFEATLEVLRILADGRDRWVPQVNTLVSKESVMDLPEIAHLLTELGIKIWELFFLIKVGRGMELTDLSPREYEDVVHFLFEVSKYGMEVRTVEAPFLRRVYLTRRGEGMEGISGDGDYVDEIAMRYGLGDLYRRLTGRLIDLMGLPMGKPSMRSAQTRDGYGILFVAYNGDVYPSGFAPYRLGNVRSEDIVRIYRENDILRRIKRAEFRGRCGSCEYRHICGGSRARALALTGDILGEDPACIYRPNSMGSGGS